MIQLYKSKWQRRWEMIWAGLKVYLVIMGLFSFPMFILEESTQVAIWGTWQAKDDMATLLQGMEVVQDINTWEWRINLSLGWLQPIGFKSYQGWCRATDYWIEATQARILTKEPELLEGKTIRLRFNPKYIRNFADKTVLEYGNVQIQLPEPPEEEHCIIEGIVHVTPEGQIQIKGHTLPTARQRRKEAANDTPAILADSM